MNKPELALAAHYAIHSGAGELLLPETEWKIRIAPKSGSRCVAVYSGDRRFYFQAHDAWAGDDRFSIYVRLGSHITWMIERDGEKILRHVVIDGIFIDDPDEVEEVGFDIVAEMVA